MVLRRQNKARGTRGTRGAKGTSRSSPGAEPVAASTPEVPAIPKRNIIILACPCGNELETDIALEEARQLRCGFCGKCEWSQLQVKKAFAKDKDVPLEILNERNREQSGSDSGES